MDVPTAGTTVLDVPAPKTKPKRAPATRYPITPNELARELAKRKGETRDYVTLGKRIRGWLRANGYRDMAKHKNETWKLDKKAADAVRKAIS